MMDKIEELKDIGSLEEESITKKKTQSIIKKAKTKTQRKEILIVQKSVEKKCIKAV